MPLSDIQVRVALTAQGMSVEVKVRSDGFAKLLVNDGTCLTQVDIGFDPADHEPVPSIVLADAFGVLPRYDRDDEYPGLTDEEYASLVEVFADWQTEIRSR